MNNVTDYLKETGQYKKGIIQDFLRMERVKYLVASGETVITKSGRYGGYTLFSDNLFVIFKGWLQKQPVPLLSRKEYEVGRFITQFFGAEVVRQYRLDGFVYDWFVPSLNLLIEFNEKEHKRRNRSRANDALKKRDNLVVINEATVMEDLADLAKRRVAAISAIGTLPSSSARG